MLNTLVIGASGYTGAELVFYLKRHPFIKIVQLAISNNSKNIGKKISDIYLKFKNIIDIVLEPLKDTSFYYGKIDVVFFATEHKISHDLVPKFLKLGCIVFDLSAAFRVNNIDFYTQYYHFTHKQIDWLQKSVYGLAEWEREKIKNAQLIALPGCYPTVSQLALKPIIKANFLNTSQCPVINAVSGVSGAGRKNTITNSFCEVSFQPYGIFNHRHYVEIIHHLGIPVIFIPHLGNFSRGILATITCFLKKSLQENDIYQIFYEAYQNQPLIRLYKTGFPSIQAIIGLPFCDIGFAVQDKNLIIIAAEDNLLKGAAAQAIQCLNIRFGFSETQSLME